MRGCACYLFRLDCEAAQFIAGMPRPVDVTVRCSYSRDELVRCFHSLSEAALGNKQSGEQHQIGFIRKGELGDWLPWKPTVGDTGR